MKLGPSLVLAAVGCVWSVAPAHAAIVDPEFQETPFASGIAKLTAMAWAPDGSNRLFVLQKGGQVRIIENGVLLPAPFAEITPITAASECGLLGIAFDPDFLSNGYVYLFATVSVTEQQIIRYTAVGNTGTDRLVIKDALPTQGENHDGGALGFGPDGKLYWAIGDNGPGRRGIDADLLVLAAKVGRANRDGSVPADNPFFDGDGPNNDYIWARGFRNPFTLTFQPTTGQLWLNVVGRVMEQVFTPRAGDDGGWDNYESNQPAGFLAPVISYYTDKAPGLVIAANGAVRVGGVVTITTNYAHRFRPGARIAVAGVVDPSFDATAIIRDVQARSFSYDQVGVDAASGGGTATPELIGGCVTGGEFWDSAAAPASYQGNFFFGDYNSGVIRRVTLGDDNQVVSSDTWATGITNVVDIATGPDGDLYYAGYTGAVYRARRVTMAQAIIASRLNVRMAEGGKAAFEVRLAVAPTKRRAVSVQWQSGDGDIAINEGAALEFTTANWETPQRVLLGAAQDADSVEDSASLRLTSSGLSAVTVNVRVTDDETFSIVTSPSSLELSEGDEQELQVSLTQPPSAGLELGVALSSDDPSLSILSGTTLTFDATNWDVPQQVRVAAAEDDDVAAGVGTLSISGPGLPAREVSVTVRDNDDHAPQFTSLPVVDAVVNAPYAYDVEVDALPEANFSLDLAPSGMTIDPLSGLIEWRPLVEGSEAVTVRAANGIEPDALQSFEIDVVADEPPSCSLTAPRDGDTIGGIDAEFFGDVVDDVGAASAQFLLDGVLAYEDENEDGHYHFGGSHHLFDTTQLANGEHVLAMKGYDTAGQSCIAQVTVTVDNPGGDPLGKGGVGVSGGGPEAGGPGRDGAGGVDTGSGEPAAAGESNGEAAASRDSGCACRTTPTPGAGNALLALLGSLALLARRRAYRIG